MLQARSALKNLEHHKEEEQNNEGFQSILKSNCMWYFLVNFLDCLYL